MHIEVREGEQEVAQSGSIEEAHALSPYCRFSRFTWVHGGDTLICPGLLLKITLPPKSKLIVLKVYQTHSIREVLARQSPWLWTRTIPASESWTSPRQKGLEDIRCPGTGRLELRGALQNSGQSKHIRIGSGASMLPNMEAPGLGVSLLHSVSDGAKSPRVLGIGRERRIPLGLVQGPSR